MENSLKSVNQTQKKKKSRATKKLWAQFDDVMEKEDHKKNLECLYSKQTVGNRTKCDLCNFPVAYNYDRFLTCTNTKCSIIYRDQLDESAEWRYYGADDTQHSDPTRCGMPINPLLEESSYGCKVTCFRSSSSYEMRKIRRYTEWQSMPYKEKSQYDEFQKIKILSRQAGIPKLIIDEALRYHKNISEMKTFRGCNRDGIIAASIYIACRIHNYPRTAKEIAVIFKLDNAAATKGCKNAVHLVNQLEKNMNNNDKTRFHVTTPVSFIERYCSKLGLNKEITMVCLFVAKRIQDSNRIPENTPHSVAAGIIYFVAQTCCLNISKHNVNQISGISEVTINKCFKKLSKLHTNEQLIPTMILNKYID